jgi:multiple sugar transport system substrate-binding protein
LLQKKGLWIIKEVKLLIRKEFRVKLSQAQVIGILREKLKMHFGKLYPRDYRRPSNAEERLEKVLEKALKGLKGLEKKYSIHAQLLSLGVTYASFIRCRRKGQRRMLIRQDLLRHNLWLIGMIIALALTGLGAGCQAQKTTTPTPISLPGVVTQVPLTEQAEATISFACHESELSQYEELAKQFQQQSPHIKLRVISIEETLGLDEENWRWPEDALQQLVSAADTLVVWIHPGNTYQGLVQDLTSFIEADPNFQPEDFYPGTLERYQWDGGTWALPITIDFQLICYHKDAFDKVGVPYPEPGWTWEDFLSKVRALTVREGDKVTRWGLALLFPHDAWSFIEGRVGPLLDTTTDPPTPRFDRPEVIGAVRWYTDMFLKEKLMTYVQRSKRPEGGSFLDMRMLYNGGLAAMWVDTYTVWRGTVGWPRVDIVPFPVDNPTSRSTLLLPRAVVMSAGTRYPYAAWRWMDFLSKQAISAWGIHLLPARRSVAEMSGFWDKLDGELADVLRYAIDHGYTRLQGPEHDLIRANLLLALDAIIKGEKSVEEAMAEAQEQAMTHIQEYLARLAQVTPVPPFVVAAPEEQKPAGEEVMTITFTPGLGSLGMQQHRDLVKRFHETHPDIMVEVKAVPFLTDPRDLQSLANAADCFLGYPSFQEPENRAAILNLEPLLEADPSFAINDFYPQVLEQFTWQGQLWGLPAEVEPYVIEYNKDLFDAADLDYPPLDWTPDDFLALAVALTQGGDDDKQYGFVPEAYEGNALPVILERLGARLIDESVDPPALSFDDPATIEALRWYAELATVHGVRPLFVTDLAELEKAPSFYAREVMINEGRAAMWTSSSSQSAMALGRNGLNIGVAPLPFGQGGTNSYLSARGYFISAWAEDPRACWEWISFLTGQWQAVRGLPARRSVAESEAYRQQVGEERAVAYLTSVAGLERPFQIFSEESWLRGAIYWLFQAYGQVLKGEASVEEALGIAQRMADDYRACVMARDAFSDRGGWQACLIEVDPTLPDFVFEAEEGE